MEIAPERATERSHSASRPAADSCRRATAVRKLRSYLPTSAALARTSAQNEGGLRTRVRWQQRSVGSESWTMSRGCEENSGSDPPVCRELQRMMKSCADSSAVVRRELCSKRNDDATATSAARLQLGLKKWITQRANGLSGIGRSARLLGPSAQQHMADRVLNRTNSSPTAGSSCKVCAAQQIRLT